MCPVNDVIRTGVSRPLGGPHCWRWTVLIDSFHRLTVDLPLVSSVTFEIMHKLAIKNYTL